MGEVIIRKFKVLVLFIFFITIISVFVSSFENNYIIIDSRNIINIDDANMLDKFTHLKGIKDISFDVASSKDFKANKIEKSNDISDKKVKNKFKLNNLEIETEYKEVDTGFFNIDTRPIKQTYIIKNLLNENRDVKLNIRYEIDSSSVTWNGTEYEISENPKYFEAFYVEEELFLGGIKGESLTGHTLYFENNYYDFKDVVELDYKVSVYSKGNKNYIDLKINSNIDTLKKFTIDPEIGWTTRNITTSADGAMDTFAIDMDGDGDIDVLSASQYDDKIAWYENDGNSPPDWVARNITTSGDEPHEVFAIDLDNDTDIDVVSGGATGVKWYENNGSTPPGWTARTIETQSYIRSVYAADLDNDTDIDVLSADSTEDRLYWYENDGNSPPGWTKRLIGVDDPNDGFASVYARYR